MDLKTDKITFLQNSFLTSAIEVRILGIACVFLMLSLLYVFSSFQKINSLTPSQKRGKIIYEKGSLLNDDPITARISDIDVPATTLPCSSCHGFRGKGNPEGGITPSNIQWNFLIKPYGVRTMNGRIRTPYTENALKRAIKDGIDVSGNVLDPLMPKYEMNDQQIDDLIEYLKVIADINDPGVYGDSINIGVMVDSIRSNDIKDVIKAYFDWINERGGIYQRKITLHFYNTSESEILDLSRITAFVIDNQIFAFVASYLPPRSFKIINHLTNLEVPLIGALSGRASHVDYSHPVYFLFPDIFIQSLDLVLSNITVNGPNKILIWYNLTPHSQEIKEFIQNNIPREYEEYLEFYSPENINIIDEIKRNESDSLKVISLLTMGSLKEMLSSITNLEEIDELYIPGELADDRVFELPGIMDGHIFLSYPTWITERKNHAMQSYYNLIQNNELSPGLLSTQLHALSASRLFTDVLKKTGRELTRQKLILEIEKTQNYKTGFSPLLTFDSNRKIGSNKIFEVKIDLNAQSIKLHRKRRLITND